jgi:glutamate-1-semialdehyde aminotransferase
MGRIDRNHAHLAGELSEFARTTGIPVAVQGHPRLQPVLTLGRERYEEKTYRALMSASSPWQFRALIVLALYLRLEGVYVESFPTMYLSAAHTEEDVRQIARATKTALLKMKRDGLLTGV